MALIDFIKEHDIDLKALERMRKRIFVLGRFNNKPLNKGNGGDAPDLFLFSNRKDISDTYQENFTAHRRLDYSSFVDTLKPRIAEKQELEEGFRTPEGLPIMLNSVKLDANNLNEEGIEGDSYVINALNYFFLRAVSTTKQKQLLKDLPDLPELIDEAAAGKTIYNQIRTNLSAFCAFQPRTVELIDAIARLFAKCKMNNAIPSGYSYGEKLPVRFSQKLIDYLYDEDGPAEFSIEDIDFAVGCWEGLVQPERAKKARKAFSEIVTSFKNELLGNPPQFNFVRYTDGNLSTLTTQAINENIKKEFKKSKDAFNMLRQIMRSKVLLSMVVEWILAGLRDLPSTRNLPTDTLQQNKAIENAMLNDWEQNKLAKPIRRPSKNERRVFSHSMSSSFDALIQAVLSNDKNKLKALSPEFKKLAEELLSDEEKIESIRMVTNFEDAEKYGAFKGAIEVVFMDLISPKLYKEPGLNLHELKKKLKAQTMSAYLSAMMLSESNMEAFGSIVTEEFLDYFYEKIDEKDQTISDKDEILSRIVGDVVNMMTRDEIRSSLEEGMRVLNEIGQLKNDQFSGENTVIPVGKIVPKIPNEIEVGSLFEEEKNQIEVAEEMVLKTFKSKLATGISDLKNIPEQSDKSDNSSEKGAKNSASNDDEKKSKKVKTSKEDSEKQQEEPLGELQKKTDDLIDFILENNLSKTKDKEKINLNKEVDKAWKQFKAKESTMLEKVSTDVSSYEQIMHLIYTRYNKNPQAKTFRNSVEGMTLMNLMLLFQEDLGFGKTYSNLYDLLIDLIINLNADDPEASPKRFLQERTLTKYFDDALFDHDGKGYTALMTILKRQGKESLDNVVHFVSELRGMKYLMDLLKDDSEVEIIVVNATATEFLNWLKIENLTPDFKVNGKNHLRLRAGFLINEQSDKLTPPGLMYVTDLAFPENLGNTHGDKVAWIKSLKQIELEKDKLAFVLPPTIISTSVMSKDMQWHEEGKELAPLASAAAAPIAIIGPSPRLNEDGAFPTVLPAGYLFCVHYLSGGNKKQDISIIGGAGGESVGRFKVIGRGAVNYERSMEEVIWGNKNDTYCLAADYYLYLIIQILSTLEYQGFNQNGWSREDFYEYFWYGRFDNKSNWESSSALNKAMIGGNMLKFYMEYLLLTENEADSKPLVERNNQNIEDPTTYPLSNVKKLDTNKLDANKGITYSDFGWFQKVRETLKIP